MYIHTPRAIRERIRILQERQIIVPLRVYETLEWCNSLISIPKSNGTICLCLDLATLNEALIKTVHRKPTFIDIFPGQRNACYLTLIRSSSGYHKVKLDKYLLYLTSFLSLCQVQVYETTI